VRNRVHRRVIIRDYGNSIYKASSRVALLAALEGCIEGYESLHTLAGTLQSDVSPNNLMMNEEDDNHSWSLILKSTSTSRSKGNGRVVLEPSAKPARGRTQLGSIY
jgi:hypothetical protein